LEPVKVRVPQAWHGLPVAELRQRVAAALQELRASGEPLHHPELGEVHVTGQGIKKALSTGADPAKLLLLGDLRNAFAASVYAGAQPAVGKGLNVVAFDKLLVRIDVAGTDMAAVFSVQRTTDGRHFYNAVTLDHGQKKTPAASPGDTPTTGERATPANTGVGDFVRLPLARVNPDTVSKVVDPDTGEPLVVYHGTRPGNDFSVFEAPSSRDGIYFTPDAEYASAFTEELFGNSGAAGAIYPSYLSVQNPYIVRSDDIESDEAQSFLYRGLDRSELEKQGYDGAMLYLDGELDQIIAFKPEQIKSATGNRGTFDAADPDIRYSVDAGNAITDTASYEPASPEHQQLADTLAGRLSRTYGRTIVLDAVAPGSGAVGGRGRELAAVSTVARRLFGHEVVFVRFNGKPLFNGAMSTAIPDVLFINADATKPMMAVLGHELLHHLKRTNEGIYNTLNDRLNRLKKNERDYLHRLEVLYGRQGAKAPANWDEELNADIVGDFFMDSQFWRDLAGNQPGLFRRVVNAVLKFLDDVAQKIADLRPFGTDQFLTDIAAARAAVVDAMRQFSGAQVGAMANQSEGVALSVDGLPETIEVDGVQRPTRNSNGQPIHPTEEGIRNFWRWFSGSRALLETSLTLPAREPA